MEKECRVVVTVRYDDCHTDPETIAEALGCSLRGATSTHGLLEDLGDPLILSVEAEEEQEEDDQT